MTKVKILEREFHESGVSCVQQINIVVRACNISESVDCKALIGISKHGMAEMISGTGLSNQCEASI